MTVLTATPKITAVAFKGLDKVSLPFTSHVIEGLDDSEFNTKDINALADNNDKYYVKSISGLEPPGRTVAIAHTASGGNFQGVTIEDRELVVLIGLNPDWDKGETPKMLRDNLYTMLYTGYDPKVDIQLIAGIFPIAHEVGYITKFEATLFDANPAVQLTFTMLNPTFSEFGPSSYSPGDLSEKSPNIYNYGTAETGFKFAVKFTGTKNGWYIKQAANQRFGMTFDMTFHSGDVLAVSTIKGQRYVHWSKHRGKVKNKLDILSGDSEWIQLHPGNNHFLVPKKTSDWDWKGRLSYTVQYAGV